MQKVYTASLFGIEDCFKDKSFAGFTAGERWNGNAFPYFPKESADKLMAACIADGGTGEYDEQTDTYTLAEAEIADDPENNTVSKGMAILVDGQQVHVYPIGAGSWCWVERHPPMAININHFDVEPGLKSWVALRMGTVEVLAYGVMRPGEGTCEWHGDFTFRNGSQCRSHGITSDMEVALDEIYDEIQAIWRPM